MLLNKSFPSIWYTIDTHNRTMQCTLPKISLLKFYYNIVIFRCRIRSHIKRWWKDYKYLIYWNCLAVTVCKHWKIIMITVGARIVWLAEPVQNLYNLWIFAEQKYRPRSAWNARELTITWRNILNVPISKYLYGVCVLWWIYHLNIHCED